MTGLDNGFEKPRFLKVVFENLKTLKVQNLGF